ncbi:MAG: sigma-70 family RNA polymerase sigma factor [Planctomycetota bacterium]|nr:MAG: sigma-70 family RNA polymerase sigma factor [Planctomycetota bacterium]MCQ3919351.1 hypothetical protein [Planctomycetota bacterium]
MGLMYNAMINSRNGFRPAGGCAVAEATQSTLLQRIRDPSDHSAWREFDRIYRPMMVQYALARGMQPADADDIVQQTNEGVLRGLTSYKHRQEGGFRAWLRLIIERRVRDHFRRRRETQATTAVLEAQPSDDPPLTTLWDRQWCAELLRICAMHVRNEVAPHTFAAFCAHAIEGRPADAVASDLGMKLNQVYIAKHRVMRRIRELINELSDGKRKLT